ncbi:MAG: MFS transporter [Bacteroidales bacterium]|nr:MFS transporter [Bacteroidales bacterium]
MATQISFDKKKNLTIVKWLTYMMFLMFAMTTDAVGVIIPEVMKQFNLSMTAAGLLHYGPMVAIAAAGIFLGFLADKLGRKVTIVMGLTLFVLSSYMFLVGSSFGFFLALLMVSGLAIGIFKTGALALIGDISTSTREHTSTMNNVEGFFGVGAIIGPFIVTYFLSRGVEWRYLYVVAATLSVVLIVLSLLAKYPKTTKSTQETINLKRTMKMIGDPYALGFSVAAFLYVSVETAIYVWMPTLIFGYEGDLLLWATYALPIFFVLRAGGRFLGAWVMQRYNWAAVLAVFSFLILLCFGLSVVGGSTVRVLLLPLSGLFMSVMYPTINSKGISCFPKVKGGAVSGIILFFTAAGAALGPLSMGIVSDAFNSQPIYGFMLATFYAAILFIGMMYNWIKEPTKKRLLQIEETEYHNNPN